MVFSTTPPPDTTPPTVTSTTPAAGATGVATTTTVSAVFSEPVQPRHRDDDATVTLAGPGGPVSPAGVTYDAGSRTATLTPIRAARGVRPRTPRRSRADPTGVKDPAGNALAADRTWSFTTAAAPPAAPSGLTATASRDRGGVGLGGQHRCWGDGVCRVPGHVTERHVHEGERGGGVGLGVGGHVGADGDLVLPGDRGERSGAESGPSAVVSAIWGPRRNRIANPGFETDANADIRPDSWTSSARFTRQAASARSGTWVVGTYATNNPGYTIGQT